MTSAKYDTCDALVAAQTMNGTTSIGWFRKQSAEQNWVRVRGEIEDVAKLADEDPLLRAADR